MVFGRDQQDGPTEVCHIFSYCRMRVQDHVGTEMLVVGLLTDGSGPEKRAEPAGFYILFSRIRSEIPMR